MGLGFRIEGLPEEHPLNGERPQWSYSGFGHFRRAVAECIGLELIELWNEYPENQVKAAGRLTPLLVHSDCEGIMTPQECNTVVPSLKMLLADWSDVGPLDKYNNEYNIEQGLRLVRYMEYCAIADVNLIFC